MRQMWMAPRAWMRGMDHAMAREDGVVACAAGAARAR